MNAKPLLLAVTGPDGSGKSTACAAARALLAARLGFSAAVEVSVWDALATQDGVAPVFADRAGAERYLADLEGVSRCLFIFHALARAVQLAQRRHPRIILLNGYWYKYAVSEIGYGVDPDFVLGAASGFAPPAHVFSLDLDPATAWERRKSATAYEQGGRERESVGSDRERFIQFQSKLRAAWEGVEAQSGLHWEHLSAHSSPAEIAAEIAQGALMRLGMAVP